MQDFDDFLLWEAKTRDTIDFKKAYVDMAGDLVAGLMLSQIIYWFLPNQHNQSKLRVYKDGHYWLAKRHRDWKEECRISQWQAPRALKILESKGLIVTTIYKFDGSPTVHIRINQRAFMEAWEREVKSDSSERPESKLVKDQNPNKEKTRIQTSERPESLTETTPKITAKSTAEKEPSPFSEKANGRDFLALSAEIGEGQRKQIEPVRVIAEKVRTWLHTSLPEWGKEWEYKWEGPISEWLKLTDGDVDRVLMKAEKVVWEGKEAGLTLTTPGSLSSRMRQMLKEGGDSVQVW